MPQKFVSVHYEELGLIPPVSRSTPGYRVFTEEHVAYFVCIREMRAGFSLTWTSKILKAVIAKRIESALWTATKAQADLHRDKMISEKIMLHLLQKAEKPLDTKRERLTIHEVSRETGVPATTIRYWDKVGLISVECSRENNYRLFTPDHIRQILAIYALKFSVYGNHRRYSVERVKEELKAFDYNDRDRLTTLANDLKQHLDNANRNQIKGIAAFYRLCIQVETNHFGFERKVVYPS